MLLLVITVVVVVLDQIVKLLIVHNFELGESITVIPGFFDLVFAKNSGIAFGLMPGKTWLFITASIAAVVILLLFLRQLDGRERLGRVGCALILGGAIGNLIDRVRLHYVVDYLDFYWTQYHWPAFNLADTAVCTGIGLFLLSMWLQSPAKQGTELTPPDKVEEL